jgi:BRCT domain type II-containing protein
MFGSRRSRAAYSSPRSGYTTRSRHTTRKTSPRAGGGIFSGRRRRAPARAHHTHTHTTTTTHHRAPATHHRRKPSLGDKISGALMKVKGSLTRRPGVKAAGTRRMHGTDGRGSRRSYGRRY